MSTQSMAIVVLHRLPYRRILLIVCVAISCAFPLQALAQNSVPIVEVNTGISLSEGASVTITNSQLRVADAEQGAESLTYTVTEGPTHGSLFPASGFTQYDIDDGLVTYTHDGGESTMDYFTFVVDDGVGGTTTSTSFIITITPVNDDPVLTANNGLDLDEGATASIGTSALQVTDVDNTPEQLIYTITVAPVSGILEVSGNALLIGGTFTQDDVNTGLLTYDHDGGESLADNFAFTVSDGVGGSVPSTQFNITITPVNDGPVIVTNTGLTVDEGEAGAGIGTDELEVTDAEQDASSLTYTVSVGPTNGTLSQTIFTQEQINGGLVTYTHDGSETVSDNFTFTVSDGVGGTVPSTQFNITVTPLNDGPVIVTNTGLTVDEGEIGAGIGTDELEVTDEEQDASSLTYTVSMGPTNGTLSQTVFTQEQINAGLVTYTHDGSETVSDNFTFTVSDGVGGTVQGTFVITVTPVDDPPVPVNNGLSVVRGRTETITRGQLYADDTDTAPADLGFTVTAPPSEGTLALNGSPGVTTFTQDDIDYGRLKYEHSGSSSTSDLFSFEISDLTTTTGPYDFLITVLGTSENPPAIGSIVDVGNDQGRSVLITFEKCGADTTGSPTPVLEYGAFRRIDPLPISSFSVDDKAPTLDGWVFAGSVPANGESIYNIVAPTLADSTAEQGIHWSVFFIRAMTADPTIYFDSAPDSGYSIDNLAPSIPQSLAYNTPGVLVWDDVSEPDFDFYTVYGSAAAIFDETAEVLGHATEPTFDVQGQIHAHFFVTATDFNGNEGDPAGIANPTAIHEPPPALVTGIYACPNPFKPATSIVYTIADPGPVTVAVYDATGKLIAKLVDNEYREPNVYRVEFQPRGASGVYFVQLKAAGQEWHTKLVRIQ